MHANPARCSGEGRDDRGSLRASRFAVVAATLVVTGCATAGAQATTVSLVDARRFEPAAVTIGAGDEVVWHNASVRVHSVEAGPELPGTSLPDGVTAISSGDLDPADTWTHRFDVPGSYVLVCRFHHDDGMVAVVEVRA